MTGPELRENFLAAMDTIRARKGRSALTILGIVIGVTSVISVAAIITGLNKSVAERIQALGARVFIISRLPFGTNPTRMPEAIRIRKYLLYEDAVAIREGCPLCEISTAFGTRAFFFGQSTEIRRGREKVDSVIIRGVDPEYAGAIQLFAVDQGRFISAFDLEHASFVCVLGKGIADALFPVSDPIGQEVTLNGLHYEVVGIFEKDPGLFGGAGVDRFVVIPWTTFHKLYPDSKEVVIAVSVRDPQMISQAQSQVIEVLRRQRHVPFNKENDFEIGTPDFFLDLWKQLTGAIVILTGVISSIGLLVGGIGVMNIMLISVTERTQEIGVRKAVGARKQDIRAQFLIEAMVLTCFGGAIGILAGATISFLVHKLVPGLPAEVSAFWVAMGFSISGAVGLFFGFYPANRAANLDPITCLRYE
jgi:putative ABC transport system permease protein